MSCVLDTSAILAFLWREPGADQVAEVVTGASVSTVSLAELVAKLVDRGAQPTDIDQVLSLLPLKIEDFSQEDAIMSGLLRDRTRALGLSLGDRACLALGRRVQQIVYTADKVWETLSEEQEICVIR